MYTVRRQQACPLIHRPFHVDLDSQACTHTGLSIISVRRGVHTTSVERVMRGKCFGQLPRSDPTLTEGPTEDRGSIFRT